ncbi:MAG: hypothetical protein ACC653_13020 [Gammaproteobacteria bacterium]
MINRYSKIFMLFACVILSACDGPKLNSSKTTTPLGGGQLVANKDNGKIYYETNCGGCHKAGADDLNAVFGAPDLASSTKIASDLSQFGGVNSKLMKRFSNISKQRVLDLNEYLGKVNP